MTSRILVFVVLAIAALLLPQTATSAPRPPQPPWPQPTLRTYGFDSPYWSVPWNDAAINEDKATLVESFSGYALVREGWMAAPVIIPAGSERKNPNIAPSFGSIRFWIAPNWSSAGEKFAGSGPGHLARLLELVDFSGKTPVLRWSLYVNESGDTIYLTGETGKGVTDLLNAPVEFQANSWRMVTLCYSTTNVVLLIDNEIIASGEGLAAPSDAVAMNLGLVVGSDSVASLGSAAEAQFEEVTTMEHWPRKSDWQDMYFKGTKQRSLLGPKESRQKEQEKIAALKDEGLLPEDYGMERFYGGGSGTFNALYSTNDLWLEITEITNDYAYLVLHGTDENKWYQLLSKTNLAQPGPWTLGEAKQGDYGTNATGFSAVFVGDNTNMFFRAHQADGYVTIYPGATAYEPSVAMPGQSSDFYIYSSSPSAVTVYYQMSGVAQNGVDYTNVTGSVNVPATSGVYVEVQPKPDAVVEGDESIIMTLVQTNDYVILGDDHGQSVLKDYSTTLGIVGVTHGVEPDGPPGAAATVGSATLNRYDYRNLYPPLTVRYSFSGTASNGVDYATLTGSVTFADQDSTANIDVTPLSDSLIESAETVKVTLLTTNLYEVPPGSETNTVKIFDTTTTVSVGIDGDSVEPQVPSSTPFAVGAFVIARTDERTTSTPLVVSYTISGTALAGIDYTNFPGSVTIPANETAVRIHIHPLPDIFVEPTETVTLTLLAPSGDGFLIDSNYPSVTLGIHDTAPNIFQPVLTNLPGPVGIDYHQPSNSLIVSYHFPTGLTNAFARIYTNGAVSNSVVVTNWSGIGGLQEEVKLATVKTTANGFTNGDTFFGTGTNAIGSRIGWISANGAAWNTNWLTLTNETQHLRGGLYVDQSGSFGGDLIAVMSNETGNNVPKGVWRVKTNGTSQLVASINTSHLEGVITLTNDVAKWGPLAARIVSGDEFGRFIYAIATNGGVTTINTDTLFPGGIRPEDFDLIPADQDLYACDGEQNTLVKLSRNYFTNYVGDLLVTDAGEVIGAGDGKLFILHWNAATTNFVTHAIQYLRANGTVGKLEHVTFAPINLPVLTP